GLNTAGNNRQIVSAPVQELSQTLGKADSPLLAGLGGLFSASSSLADDTPDNPGERKKKKKKRHLKL
ncbi:MAG: mobilization protein, partial [Bacteroides ovatus]